MENSQVYAQIDYNKVDKRCKMARVATAPLSLFFKPQS